MSNIICKFIKNSSYDPIIQCTMLKYVRLKYSKAHKLITKNLTREKEKKKKKKKDRDEKKSTFRKLASDRN